MKTVLLQILALLLLWLAPAWAGCANKVAATGAEEQWRGSGLTLEVFEKWLETLSPASEMTERMARVARQELLGSNASLEGLTVSESDIARAINAGLRERSPHDRLKSLVSQLPIVETTVFGLGFDAVATGLFIVIEAIRPGSAAAQAGLRLGDKIERVNEWTLSDYRPKKLAHYLRFQSQEHAPVRLQIRRGESLLDFTLQPGPYPALEKVEAQFITVDGSPLGVLKIRDFLSLSVQLDVGRVLKIFRKQKVKGLILDLRGNPGGYVDIVKRVAGYFLGKKQLVFSEEPLSAEFLPEEHFTDSAARVDVPIMTLVDCASASAAELLAGVLQYYRLSYLVGPPSYGKGTVQTPDCKEAKVFEGLPVALYATKSFYLLPCGTTPQKTGLLPDFYVTQPFLTSSLYTTRERSLPNSLPPSADWEPCLSLDPVRDRLKETGLEPRVCLSGGDYQKEVAITLLLEWIRIKAEETVSSPQSAGF